MSKSPTSTPLPSKARIYTDVNSYKPTRYWDFESHVDEWGNLDAYKLGRILGEGNYSEVYEGIKKKTKQRVAIKILDRISDSKIKREIQILENLRGGPNIVRLLDTVKSFESGTTALVFEFLYSNHYKKLYENLTDYDIRFYINEILKALDFTHSMGIMHRDLKPENILIDHRQRTLRIIDWGLADFYHPGLEYSVRVASLHYKAPELLVEYEMYDYSLDMWSLGCILASMVFQKEPFFFGHDDINQMVRIINVLGTDDFYKYIKKYQISLDPRLKVHLVAQPRQKWDWFVNIDNKHLVNPEAYDIIENLLQYDHQLRLTAQEAMHHPYFLPLIKGQALPETYGKPKVSRGTKRIISMPGTSSMPSTSYAGYHNDSTKTHASKISKKTVENSTESKKS
ncbi:casein kinase II subunit alpha-like [Suncus etruscus]|uniref:casein kinase II subunit alpha-like n=1 Tax=Suncus etruscus TaxID=109475 RepID=UPI0021106C0F|nr:casein kinase II subunit alpha-like [Suncus etruscus]